MNFELSMWSLVRALASFSNVRMLYHSSTADAAFRVQINPDKCGRKTLFSVFGAKTPFSNLSKLVWTGT